jgi:hypothetical protein
MFTLNDTREAQHMWEQKFSNAGREGIVLADGKAKGLFHRRRRVNEARVAKNNGDFKWVASPSRASS